MRSNSSNKFVYVVKDKEDYTYGFFALYEEAFYYALESMKKYDEKEAIIEKHLIVKSEEDKIVRNPARGNKYLGFNVEKIKAYTGDAISTISNNKEGEIIFVWSNELSDEEEEIVDEYNPNRFEYQFIKIPFEMQEDAIVKDINTCQYGILENGKVQWQKYIKRIEERNLYVDYSDVQVIVYH